MHLKTLLSVFISSSNNKKLIAKIKERLEQFQLHNILIKFPTLIFFFQPRNESQQKFTDEKRKPQTKNCSKKSAGKFSQKFFKLALLVSISHSAIGTPRALYNCEECTFEIIQSLHTPCTRSGFGKSLKPACNMHKCH